MLNATGFKIRECWKPSSPNLLGPRLGWLVACINLEFYLAKAVIERWTQELGQVVPLLHNHPVYFTSAWAGMLG